MINDYFFKEIGFLYKKYELLKSQEEKFNIFSVLYKNHEEKRLHSRFISCLLDPFGSHNVGDKFLNEFLAKQGFSENEFKNTIVYPKECDKKEYENIDILIISKETRRAIIIENKIYASDSNNEEGGQLERYFKYIRDIEKIPANNISVYYLTFDGREPSEESLGSFKSMENINCKCITYSEEINEWLNSCLVYINDKPFIRESIFQYKKLINLMSNNDTTVEERKALQNKIGESDENLYATKYLMDNLKHVKWHSVFDFWNELRICLEDNKFVIEKMPSDDDITNLTHFESYKKGQKGKQECGIEFKNEEGLTLWIWNEADDYLYWGVTDTTNLSNIHRTKFNQNAKLNYMKFDSHSHWESYGFDNEDRQIYLSDFSKQGTFNLISQAYRGEIVKEIVAEILMILT